MNNFIDNLSDEELKELYKKEGAEHSGASEPTEENTKEQDLSQEEKIERLTDEDYAYYRSSIWMQMYDDQSEIAEELLDDAQLGKLYRIARHYLKTGEEPNYKEIKDKLLASQIKSWINALNLIFDYKVRQSLKSRGKGAPKGNQNARKKRVKVSNGVNKQKQTKTN